MQYQCNNSFYRPEQGLHYNMSEIIGEAEYNSIPEEYKKWFTEVGKPLHFYCKRLTESGWEINPMGCADQCFDCMATVGERQQKTKQLQ